MEMISYCGLSCSTCPIHLASLEENEICKKERRISIAKELSKLYSRELKAEEINDCDGCLSASGRLFSWCHQCEVRSCASSRNIENCAYCKDFACETLSRFFLLDPSAKKRLKEIRALLS